MKNVKKGRVILISAISLLVLSFLTIIVIGFSSSYNIKNKQAIKIKKKFDLSQTKEAIRSSSGSWDSALYRLSVWNEDAKTVEEKIQEILSQSGKYLSREMNLAFRQPRNWICDDVVIKYYPYGQKNNFWNSWVENIFEIKVKKNIEFLKNKFTRKGKILKRDFPIPSSSIGYSRDECIFGNFKVARTEMIYLYDRLLSQEQMINLAIHQAIDLELKLYDVIQVAITDIEHPNYALTVVKYYPKGYDENKQPVENTLEVYVKDPNIDLFETIYVEKNELK